VEDKFEFAAEESESSEIIEFEHKEKEKALCSFKMTPGEKANYCKEEFFSTDKGKYELCNTNEGFCNICCEA